MLYQELQRLDAENRPIRIATHGAGWMGSGFVRQVGLTPGMQVSVLVDPNLSAARQAFLDCGIPAGAIVEITNSAQAMDALRAGKRLISESIELATQIDAIDVVTDVTPCPAAGAITAETAILYGKDVVLINIETDVTIGRQLKRLAQQAGVLYSVSSGDEPGCLIELFDFVCSLGYQPVVIGKGKNNPLDPYATPDTVLASAQKAGKDAYQVASYVDGTKTMFEMTCAANATGCRPMQRGMLGPQADLSSVSQVFALQSDGGLACFPGAVDFVQGSAMAGGVFATVRIEDERIRADLEYLKVGKGYYYTFFRPYHLWFLEAPISIARAHLFRHVTLTPLDQPVADVLTIAKRDLLPAECLDDFGGYTFYGVIDQAAEIQRLSALPTGLAPGARLVRPVQAGQVITWEDVQLDESQAVVRLRRAQDKLLHHSTLNT